MSHAVVQGCCAGCAFAIVRQGLRWIGQASSIRPLVDRVCAALDAPKIRVLGLYVILFLERLDWRWARVAVELEGDLAAPSGGSVSR
jgi:hypothetical protein